MNANELLQYKAAIDQKKEEKIVYESKKKDLLETLKSDYEIKDVVEAKKRITELEEEISEIETTIEKSVEELEEILDD